MSVLVALMSVSRSGGKMCSTYPLATLASVTGPTGAISYYIYSVQTTSLFVIVALVQLNVQFKNANSNLMYKLHNKRDVNNRIFLMVVILT